MKKWFVAEFDRFETVLQFANKHNLGPGEFMVVEADPGEYSRFGGGRMSSVTIFYYAEKELKA